MDDGYQNNRDLKDMSALFMHALIDKLPINCANSYGCDEAFISYAASHSVRIAKTLLEEIKRAQE